MVCYCQQWGGEHINNVKSEQLLCLLTTPTPVSLAAAIHKSTMMHLMPGGNNT